MTVEFFAEWYGGIESMRVHRGEYTGGMQRDAAGLYVWSAEREGRARVLYVGQSRDMLARQRSHLSGQVGRNLQTIASRGWKAKLWVGFLACEDFCRGSEARVARVLSDAEKTLIYRLRPEWNRASAGYMTLREGVRIENAGRRPSGVPRVVRLSAGDHA